MTSTQAGKMPPEVLLKAAPPHKYSLITPRFWHGMLPLTWWRLLRRNRFSISWTRLPTVMAICCFTGFNLICTLLDNLIYSRRVSRQKILEDPIFIIGHWRSGTTLLHELLICDPEFTFPTTVRCFCPTHFLLTETPITKCTGFVLPDKRPMDNMAAGWERPQEDEFALCNMGIPSPYLMMAFPNHRAVDQEYLSLRPLSDLERTRWKQALMTFLKRITFRDQRRIVVKSPTHTARIKTLLEMFPAARFIHLVRDPYALVPSTVRLWSSLNQVQGLHVPDQDDQWLFDYVHGTYEAMYECFEEDRKLLDDSQFFEIRYEDLVADPKAALHSIYEQLDLGDFHRAEPAVDAYLHAARDYRTNRLQLTAEQRHEVRRRWHAYFVRYGYSENGESKHSTAS